MKKFLVLIFTYIVVQSCSFASERLRVNIQPQNSYLLLLEKSAEVVLPSNKRAIETEILTTIYNEKNQILLKPLKPSISRLYIATDGGIVILEVNVDEANKEEELSAFKSNIVKSILKIDTLNNTTKDKNDLPFVLDKPPGVEVNQK